MPFGQAPPAPPPAPPSPPAHREDPPPPNANRLTLCAINRTPAGPVAVGFVDSSQNPPRCYYLDRGDSEGGFTVRDADFDMESATIEKDGVSVRLSLSKGPIVGGNPTETAKSSKLAAIITAPTPASISTAMGNSYIERLYKRQRAAEAVNTQTGTSGDSDGKLVEPVVEGEGR